MLAKRLSKIAKRQVEPVWQGPCGEGPNGGISQSMAGDFLCCRRRFQVKYVEGLQVVNRFNPAIEYGSMFHSAEEAFSSTDSSAWQLSLGKYADGLIKKYSMSQAEITKWYNVCRTQFPEYINYWSQHPDQQERIPLMQEQIFDVPYQLPSGRVVRLRGKFDGVDLINGGAFLNEHKTKSKVDVPQLQRQLKFDNQTMIYGIALTEMLKTYAQGSYEGMFKGVRYNVIRRDCPIKQHEDRVLKAGFKKGETTEEWMERLRRDYFAAEPHEWFWRWNSEVGPGDIKAFKDQFLDPFLEHLCDWYQVVADDGKCKVWAGPQAMNYRTPFGVYSSLQEGGATEVDEFLATGSTVGLHRVEALFPELQ